MTASALSTPAGAAVARNVITVALTRHPEKTHLQAWARVMFTDCPACSKRTTTHDRHGDGFCAVACDPLNHGCGWRLEARHDG